MAKQSEDSAYKIAFFVTLPILILVSILALVAVFAGKECPSSDAALVTIITQPWSENLYNSSELLLRSTLYNYGDSEAKDVVVSCVMNDGDEWGYIKDTTPRFTAVKNVGNLASTSFKEVEITHSNINNNNQSLLTCKIASCKNCVILDDKLKY